MKLEQLQEIMKQSLDGYSCGYFGEDDIPEEFPCEVVDDDDWTQDGKYQHSCTVLKIGDNYFQIQNTRAGSPFTDWYYGEPYISQVKPVTKTITTTTWEGV